jgi:hypothetical protein
METILFLTLIRIVIPFGLLLLVGELINRRSHLHRRYR